MGSSNRRRAPATQTTPEPDVEAQQVVATTTTTEASNGIKNAVLQAKLEKQVGAVGIAAAQAILEAHPYAVVRLAAILNGLRKPKWTVAPKLSKRDEAFAVAIAAQFSTEDAEKFQSMLLAGKQATKRTRTPKTPDVGATTVAA